MGAALRQAVRSLAHSSWYSATVAVVIALGIAFVTAIFALVDGTLFKSLPYRDADRLFAVNGDFSRLPMSVTLPPVSDQEWGVWRASLPDARFALYYTGGGATIGPKESVPSLRVSRDFFDVLETWPAVGGFEASDFDVARPIEPALLTYGFWQQRFGGDAGVIGRTFVGERGAGIRVVGVLRSDFVVPDPIFGANVGALTPLVMRVNANSPRLNPYLRIFVRPAPSMGRKEAAARLTSAAARMAATWPRAPLPAGTSETLRLRQGPYDVVTLQPIREALTSGVHRTSAIVFWAAIALALLACLNVTGLSIARVQASWRDLAVRRSLGAGFTDLVRLLAAQHLTLAVAGASLGVVMARPIVALTATLMPSSMSLLKKPSVDLRVVGFAALCVVGSAALITLGSARAAWHASLRNTLSSSGLTTTARRPLWIVSVQVALAVVLSVGGALVAYSLHRVWDEDLGLPTEHTALLRMGTPVGTTAAEVEALMADLRRQPEVSFAGGIDRWLLEHSFNGSVFDNTPSGAEVKAESIAITTGFFEAAGLAPIEGRLLTRDEISRGDPVLVVSEKIAREFWPGQHALGRLLATSSTSARSDGSSAPKTPGRAFTVVGVVPDIRNLAMDDDPRGTIYWPLAAKPNVVLSTVLIRFASKRDALPQVVAWMRSRCPGCTVKEALMVPDAMVASIRNRRFSAWLFSSFGVAALVILGVGMLGLVAMTTVRRTREIGIRVALGATRVRIVRQMLTEQTVAVLIGLCSGGTVAAWCVRLVEAYLYKTTAYDALSWATAVAALLTVSAIATLLPSVWAARIDPVVALRTE